MRSAKSSTSDSVYKLADSPTVVPSRPDNKTSSSSSSPVMRKGGQQALPKHKTRQDSETESGSDDSDGKSTLLAEHTAPRRRTGSNTSSDADPHRRTADQARQDAAMALLKALMAGEVKTAKALIASGVDVNFVDKVGNTPLFLATRWGHTKTAQHLIKAHANVNYVNKDGLTALMLASILRNTDIAKLLIKAGSELNFVAKKDGRTLLMTASMRGYADIVHVLIKGGAEVNRTDKDGCTALMLALMNDRTRIAQELIESGADIHRVNLGGETALIIALINGHTKIAQMLVKRGARVNLAREDGWANRMLALENGSSRIPAYRRRGKQDDESTLMWALKNDQPDLAFELIAGIADVNAANDAGQNALMLALQTGHLNIALSLIKHGANVNLVDIKRMTALTLAVKDGHGIDLVKLILPHLDAVYPPDPTQQMMSKADQLSVSLHYACRNKNLELVRLLLQAGARQPDELPNLVSKAIDDKNIPQLLLLLQSGAQPNIAPPTKGWPTPVHDLLVLQTIALARQTQAATMPAVPLTVKPDLVISKLSSLLRMLPTLTAAQQEDPNAWPIEQHLKELGLSTPLVELLSAQLRQARTLLLERTPRPTEAQFTQCVAGLLAGLKAARITRPEGYAPFKYKRLPEESQQQLMAMLDAQMDCLAELGERMEENLAKRLPALLDTCLSFVEANNTLNVSGLQAELMDMGLYAPLVDGIVAALQASLLITPKATKETVSLAEFGRQISNRLDSIKQPLMTASKATVAEGANLYADLLFRQLHMMSQYAAQAMGS